MSDLLDLALAEQDMWNRWQQLSLLCDALPTSSAI